MKSVVFGFIALFFLSGATVIGDGYGSNPVSSDGDKGEMLAPTFTLDQTAFVLDEDFTDQTITVTPDNGALTVEYSLSPDPSTITFADLSIDINTGGVTIASVNDAIGGEITVEVVATEIGGTPGDDEARQSFTLEVLPINDAPTFTANDVIEDINEDAGPITVTDWATAISAGGGSDESGQVLTFNVVPTGTPTGNISFTSSPSINAVGQLSYEVASNTNGSATFDVTLEDNGATGGSNVNTSTSVTLTINVSAINDAPTFTAIDVTEDINEDAGPITVANWASSISAGGGSDESSQLLTFNVVPTGTPTGNISFTSSPSISAAGQLSYEAAPNTNGSATFEVTLQDNGATGGSNVNTSSPVILTINVSAINDAPTFTATDVTEDINEDAGPIAVANWATSISAGGGSDESSQVLTFNVIPTGASTGNISFTSAPSINAAGQLSYVVASNTNGSLFAPWCVSSSVSTMCTGEVMHGRPNFRDLTAFAGSREGICFS